MVEFAPVTRDDFRDIAAIYNHYILKTTATFHDKEINPADLEEFLLPGNPRYPSFTIREAGVVIGYCFLARYKNRQAYDRTAELSIYLRPDYTKRGIGPAALRVLECAAGKAGIRVLIGTLCGENRPCIRLMEQSGYSRCGHLKHVGEKFGRILDVVVYQKVI